MKALFYAIADKLFHMFVETARDFSCTPTKSVSE